MNRRNFFRFLGVATAAVYLRLAPEKLVMPVAAAPGALTLDFLMESLYELKKQRGPYEEFDIICDRHTADGLRKLYGG